MVSTQNLKIGFISFVFFPPFFITYLPTASALLWYVKLFVMAFIILIAIKNYQYIGVGFVTITVYFFSFVVATILTNGNVLKSLSAVMPQICYLLYADIMLHKKAKKYVDAFSKLIAFYIIINAVTLILFPDGIGMFLPGYDFLRVDSRMNWLGLDNGYIKYFLVAIVVFSFSLREKPKYRNILFLIMLITMVYVWSGTGIVCLVIMLLYIFFISKKQIVKYVNYWICTAIGLISYLGIVIFRVADLFADFIVGYLGKDVTFTGRTLLWDQALLLVSKHPLIGYGVYDYDLLVSSANGQAYSAHNTILQMMLMGGVLSLFCFIMIILLAGRNLSAFRSVNNQNLSIENGVICIAILAMWICGLTENMVFDIQIYLLLLLAIDFKYIDVAYEVQA